MTTDVVSDTYLPWQASQWQQWQQHCRQGKIPHALLLAGPLGVGKQHFANYLSQALVCTSPSDYSPCHQCQACRLATTQSHPDIHYLVPDDKVIKVEAIRRLIDTTHLTAQTWQIFLLTPAEAMHPSAANALLKTLEEPALNTLLILISAEPQRLPATVRSRCQVLTFGAVDTKKALLWLEQQRSGIIWPPLLARAGGAPLLAMQVLEKKGLEGIQQLVQHLVQLRLGQVQPMHVVNFLAEQPFLRVLDDITCICYDMARLSVREGSARKEGNFFLPTEIHQLIKLTQNINLPQLLGFIDQLNGFKDQQKNNLNTTMALEKLVSLWPSLFTD